MASPASAPVPDPRRCHDPEVAAEAFPHVSMPGYEPGDALPEAESRILQRLAEVIHQIDPSIPTGAVVSELSLWQIGFSSLSLTNLREQIHSTFGLAHESVHWFQLHREVPRLGCLTRFIAANAPSSWRTVGRG
jgi:hypothetical protein